MDAIELSRTGLRPVRFDGTLLASAGGPIDASGRERTRWHDLAVYRTAGGRYVLEVALKTRWRGELDRHDVYHAEDAAEIERAAREYAPCPPGVGYPPGPRYADQQSRLVADLRRHFDAAVTDLFAGLGPDFVEEVA